MTAFEHRPGVQPNATVSEWHEADAMLRRAPGIIAALAGRGITDLDQVMFDTWTYGYALIPEQYRGRRVGWVDVWCRAAPGANPYAHPVNGLHPVVDLNRMELLDVGSSGYVDPPPVMGEYVPRHIPGYRARDDIRPLEISQPEGASFQLDGHELRWQKWSLRIGFNYREGLVLHQVGYADGDRVRPVAHRLSLAEMVVPYRDTSPEHYRRTAFDIGEWGLGFMTTSLELGCDCLGEISYLDATLHDAAGEPYDIPRAICVHEEDNGVLWKHVDPEAGAEVRRMRRLVISFHATVANYEYLVYWRFYTDGSIECEVRATGIMVVTHLPPGRKRPARWSTTGPTRRSISTSSWPGWTWTSTAPPTPSTAATPKASRWGRTIRSASRWSSGRRRCGPRPMAGRITGGKPSGPGRSSARAAVTGSAPRPRTSWCPEAVSRR